MKKGGFVPELTSKSEKGQVIRAISKKETRSVISVKRIFFRRRKEERNR